MFNHAHALKPCLVLGTGFHRWVLGKSMGQDFEALNSWPALLRQVAKALGVALDSRNDRRFAGWEGLRCSLRMAIFSVAGKPSASRQCAH